MSRDEDENLVEMSDKNKSFGSGNDFDLDFERKPKVPYCRAIFELIKRSLPAMIGMII